jgi:tRNA pseudouridine38-40 synthase
LWLEYQGTGYNGFQLQLNRPTIQGALEESLARLTGENIRIRGASRTDSGAHAQGQVVDFLTCSRHPAERFMPALNFFLPEDIRVRKAMHVPDEFHSRRSALGRVYQYRILARPEPSALRRHTHLWIKERLDFRKMGESALALEGEHDFRVISSGHPADRSAVRTVRRWRVTQEADTIVVECEANGFLKQQIRRANGILLEIGKGKHPVDLMARTLERCRGVPDIPLLPARGLCLMEVKYPAGTFEPPPT